MCTRPCNPSAPRVRANSGFGAPLALVLALGATTAQALSTDRDQPMDITADYQKTQLNSGTSQPGVTRFKGNVRMVQGSLKAQADEATMYQHPNNAKDAQGNDLGGGVQRVVLVGKPARLEERQDNNAGLVTAEGERIDYETDTGVARLSGNVRIVQQGRGEFRGAGMTYNTHTGEIESGDNTSANRVHMIVQPRAKPARPAGQGAPAGVAEPANGTP